MRESQKELTVRGRTMRVAVRAGQGPPLLLCNGVGASLDMLTPFVDQLDPRIPVVRFDVPGVGGSQLPRVPYTFATLAHMVASLLDQLEVDDFDVLGISWGGGLAQQLAFQNPRRCRRLVLVSTATGYLMVPARPRVLAKMITPRRYRDPSYRTAVAATLYGGRMRDDPVLAKLILDSHSPLISGRGYALQLAAGASWTSLPFLRLRFGAREHSRALASRRTRKRFACAAEFRRKGQRALAPRPDPVRPVGNSAAGAASPPGAGEPSDVHAAVPNFGDPGVQRADEPDRMQGGPSRTSGWKNLFCSLAAVCSAALSSSLCHTSALKYRRASSMSDVMSVSSIPAGSGAPTGVAISGGTSRRCAPRRGHSRASFAVRVIATPKPVSFDLVATAAAAAGFGRRCLY